MQRVETGNPDLMKYREPMYASWIVSIPVYFSIAGVVIYVAWRIFGGVLLSDNFDPHPLGMLVLGLLGLFLLLLGINNLFDWFGRRGCTVDRKANTLRWEWGLFLMPMLTRTVSLRRYRRLEIHGIRWVGERTGATHRTESYLELCGPDGWRLRIGRAETKDSLCAMADAIGGFADLEVVDATYSPPHVRRRIGDSDYSHSAAAKEVVRLLLAKYGIRE